ncbi:uncharacterized protein [Nicotiana sylvestris]|uniref:uncharacterized protein n=1 Tax=Nicotiana sylvestris TaxID=4096 RepID=UPI00388C39A4
MYDFIMAEDFELWDVICDGPYFPMNNVGDLPLTMPKTRKEYTDADRKVVEKNFHAKKILIAHEGTTQVKQSNIDMLTTEYKLFRMKDDESIQDMHTRSTSIINELHSLGEIIPRNKLVRKRSSDNVVKQALAAWGDSSSESEEETDADDSSMMAVESEENEYDSIIALMAQSDDDEDDDNSEVNFRDVQRNLKSYSPKKLMSLASVLIDVYHSLVEDKDVFTLELGEAGQTRDHLVVCVVDLKETISDLEKEKTVLTKNIASIEYERDDLVVVAIDYKETIENFSKEKEALVKRVTEIEEKRDDLLIVIADIRENIEGLGIESRPGNSGKGKEVASEAHVRLENELKPVKTSLCVETEKNKHLETELERGTVKGSNQQWFMDNGCSKHMTGNTMDFLSLKALQGGSVFFGNGKKGYILGVGKVRKSLSHSIENVYYANGLKYSLLSVSQICDKGNKVEFLSKICTVTNLVTGEVVLVAKRYKNIYVADFESIQSSDLSCLKVVDDDVEL